MSSKNKQSTARSQHSVWALLFVSPESEQEIQRFFIDQLGISRRNLRSKLHLSVYHARRRLRELVDREETIDIQIDSEFFRFMIMAPGGENPRPDLDPTTSAVGVRLKRSAPAISQIRALRSQFYAYETPAILAGRNPSTNSRNAFGARHYQPHITLLRPGSGINSDLTKAGVAFRSAVTSIRLDRFVVRYRSAYL